MNDYLNHEIDLQTLLPPTVSDLEEMQEIARVESKNFNEARLNIIDIFQTRSIHETNEIGLKLWEKMLKIKPGANETLDFRKRRVLSRVQGMQPYTMRYLYKLLGALLGEDGYKVNLDIINEHLDVLVKFQNSVSASLQERYYKELSEMLDRVVPLNLGIGITHRRELQSEIFFGGIVSTRSKIEIRPAAFMMPTLQQTKYYGGVISIKTKIELQEVR